jgi:hypothetical protein
VHYALANAAKGNPWRSARFFNTCSEVSDDQLRAMAPAEATGATRPLERRADRPRLGAGGANGAQGAEEPYLTLSFAPGECAQVDGGSWNVIPVGNTRRRLSFFVMVLGYSRMLYVEFTLGQSQALCI